MTAPVVAGIDYSTKALDVALVQGRELLLHQEHRLGGDLRNQVGVMTRLAELLYNRGARVIYMERPWMRPDASHGAQKLHAVPTRVETLAVAAGIRVEYVAVQQWHAQILGNGKLSRAESKAASIEVVRRVFGRVENDNAADAICLALFAQAHERREAAVAR